MTPKTGFIAPIITEDNHVFGSSGIPLNIIKVDGDWTKYIPTFESQLETTFDSDGCTVYGTLNAIETLEKYLYLTLPNYSDRYTYNSVGITPPGSDPHLVATNIRGSGLVEEGDLSSVTNSLAEFMTPRPMTIDLQVKGQKWLTKKMLGHKWLWTSQPDKTTRIALITEALTKGTVAISVDAWFKNGQGLYYSPVGMQNGHWVHVYKIDETGIYVFDSYNDVQSNTNLKKLTLDHDIQFAKVYFLTIPTQQQNWLVQLITSFLELVGLKQKQLEIAAKPVVADHYEEVKEAIKRDLLTEFCTAIRDYEGKPGDLNYKNNNPGNLRAKSGGFLKFKTYQEGFNALKDYVTRAATGKHLAYRPDFTILQFFKVYSPSSDNNNPQKYAEWVCDRLKILITTKIKDLIT